MNYQLHQSNRLPSDYYFAASSYLQHLGLFSRFIPKIKKLQDYIQMKFEQSTFSKTIRIELAAINFSLQAHQVANFEKSNFCDERHPTDRTAPSSYEPSRKIIWSPNKATMYALTARWIEAFYGAFLSAPRPPIFPAAREVEDLRWRRLVLRKLPSILVFTRGCYLTSAAV